MKVGPFREVQFVDGEQPINGNSHAREATMRQPADPVPPMTRSVSSRSRTWLAAVTGLLLLVMAGAMMAYAAPAHARPENQSLQASAHDRARPIPRADPATNQPRDCHNDTVLTAWLPQPRG
jgi:hypothetical protein